AGTFNQAGVPLTQPAAVAQPTANPNDFIGGFMNWLGQMPNPFNQGQSNSAQNQQPGDAPPALSSIFQNGFPNLSDLQSGNSAPLNFSIPGLAPADPNNPLSSPVATWVVGEIGNWINQQMKSSNPFQVGSAVPSRMPASETSLPSLFPTELKQEVHPNFDVS